MAKNNFTFFSLLLTAELVNSVPKDFWIEKLVSACYLRANKHVIELIK